MAVLYIVFVLIKQINNFANSDTLKRTIIHVHVYDNGYGQPELVTARNNPYINSYSRFQLQGWRANVDLKPILSIHAALQYVSKYTSKTEPRSTIFSNILN